MADTARQVYANLACRPMGIQWNLTQGHGLVWQLEKLRKKPLWMVELAVWYKLPILSELRNVYTSPLQVLILNKLEARLVEVLVEEQETKCVALAVEKDEAAA